MPKPTLLIVSLGELDTNLLQAVARAALSEASFVASQSQTTVQARANNAIIDASIKVDGQALGHMGL